MKRKKFMIIGTSLLVVGITLMMYSLSHWMYGTYQFFSSATTEKDADLTTSLIADTILVVASAGAILAVAGVLSLLWARSLKLKEEVRKKEAWKENASHDTGENDLMSTVLTLGNEGHDPWLDHLNAH